MNALEVDRARDRAMLQQHSEAMADHASARTAWPLTPCYNGWRVNTLPCGAKGCAMKLIHDILTLLIGIPLGLVALFLILGIINMLGT